MVVRGDGDPQAPFADAPGASDIDGPAPPTGPVAGPSHGGPTRPSPTDPSAGRSHGGRWPLHVSPWVHYATLLAIPALLAVARRVPLLRDRFVDPYIWHPIVYDLGFNPVNTALFAVVLALGVLWWFRLLHHYPIALDWPTVWSGLLVFLWGIVLRVLHDAHLIAPFREDTACVPGQGLLMGCAAVFFVTPILWVIVGSLLFPFGRLGIAARSVAARHGIRWGVAVVAAGPAAIALAAALLLRVDWTRAAPDLAWIVLACAAGVAGFAWRARRVGVRWSEAMLMQVLVLVVIILQPLWRLLRGAPDPAALAAVPLAAGLALLVWWQAHRGGRSPRPGRGRWRVAAFVYLVLLQAAALAAALVDFHHGRTAAGFGWCGLALLGTVFWMWAGRPHRAFAAWAMVPGAYIVAGHVLDALATGLGLDVFGATEKHVLARALVAGLEPLLAGTALQAYPGFVAMLLYKLPVALFAAWALHVHGRRLMPPDLLLIVQMVIGTVGAAPGLRNALRQALGA